MTEAVRMDGIGGAVPVSMPSASPAKVAPKSLQLIYKDESIFIEKVLRDDATDNLFEVMMGVELVLNAMGFSVELESNEQGDYVMVDLNKPTYDDSEDEITDTYVSDVKPEVIPAEWNDIWGPAVGDKVIVIADDCPSQPAGMIVEDDRTGHMPYRVVFDNYPAEGDYEANDGLGGDAYFDESELEFVA